MLGGKISSFPYLLPVVLVGKCFLLKFERFILCEEEDH